jgi:DnaJ family protein C protein 11
MKHIHQVILFVGLVIVKAWYGKLENLDNELDEGVIDVTIVIQTLVHESRLTIPGGHSKVMIIVKYFEFQNN